MIVRIIQVLVVLLSAGFLHFLPTSVNVSSHNSVDMALNSEEVQLFDWELLQQEIDGYISMKNESCDKNYALCFQDKEDQSLISEEK